MKSACLAGKVGMSGKNSGLAFADRQAHKGMIIGSCQPLKKYKQIKLTGAIDIGGLI